MSLSYKLWKIGNVLSDEEIWDAMMDRGDRSDDEDYQYVNIDFTISGARVVEITLNRRAIDRHKIFLTKKVGGTSNSYYMYPNLRLQNTAVKDKVQLLVNTLKYGILSFVDSYHRKTVEVVLSELDEIKKYIECAEFEKSLSELLDRHEQINEKIRKPNAGARSDDLRKIEKKIKEAEKNAADAKALLKRWNPDLLHICNQLVRLPKANYLLWLSLNGETFYEKMPEIKRKWFETPVFAENLQKGYDAFTNQEADIGYRPEVKVFSYDQYHDSMNHRLTENLPLSLESARAIKFAWMYLLENLTFYFNNLEYVLIPSVLSGDADLYRAVLKRFRQAKGKITHKKTLLESHKAQEKALEKEINKISRKKSKKNKAELKTLTKQREDLLYNIEEMDTGLIRHLDEQNEGIGDLKNTITIDYLFTKIDRTNLSFEIKGSLEDVIPSRISAVVKTMREHRVNDRINLGQRNPDETLLQDYFHRKELLCVINRSQKKNVNTILQEKLYLARLLLTDTKIDLDDLLGRFEENRQYGYDMRKRLTSEGVYRWIENSKWFTRHDETIYNLLRCLGKIKG